ncbi:hypothetical protein NSS69_11970 [Macrococcus sp. FSL W8-0367]
MPRKLLIWRRPPRYTKSRFRRDGSASYQFAEIRDLGGLGERQRVRGSMSKGNWNKVKGDEKMLKFIGIFIFTLIAYTLFLKFYNYISFGLKESKLKNNYIIDKILLSSEAKFSITDFIVVLLITYVFYRYPL